MNPDDLISGLVGRGLVLCCVDYYATGEGRTLCVAIACGREAAEKLLTSHVDPYFASGRQIAAIEEGMDEHIAYLLAYVPSAARIALHTAPSGFARYYAELYFNYA